MEVLSPVKNIEATKVVVQSGCDAIYLGSPHFSARNKVNISLEDLEVIIDYCNLYDVKTYVAFNTVIFEDEINDFLNEVISIYNLGASGIILQDFSFAKIIKQMCPTLELHASTQMNIHNTFAIAQIKDYQFKRVVVPREMNFGQIKYIKSQIAIEIETFIHGAICVSYSGQCYDSVLLDQKSANRGRCSQYCRFTQSVYKNDKKINDLNFALNIKDMNNFELLENYRDSGVDSIKIEGRLKNLDYQGLSTSIYSGQDSEYSLDQVYNREFTSGLINSSKPKELVNNKRINNTGYHVGEVNAVNKNTDKALGFYKYSIILSKMKLNKLDNIRFVSENSELGQVVEQFKIVKDEVHLFSNEKPNVNDQVYITSNHNIYEHYNKLKNTYTRRISKDVNISFFEGYVSYEIDNNFFTFEIETQAAISKSASTSHIISMLSETKNSPFDLCINIEYLQEGIYISNKQLKALKRFILTSITELKLIKHNQAQISYEYSDLFTKEASKYFIEVKTLEQYNIALKYSSDIIISSLELAREIEITDKLILKTPSVIYDDQFELYEDIIQKYKRLLVSELGMYYKYRDSHEIISNYTLNSTNSNNLNNLECSYNILSLELNKDRINLMSKTNSVIMLYGFIPVMTMDYCPINLNKQNGCGSCTLCHNNEYYVIDEHERKFNLVHDDIDKLTLNSEHPIYLNEHLSSLKINHFLIKFSTEDSVDCYNVLNAIFKKDRVNFEYEDKLLAKEVL